MIVRRALAVLAAVFLVAAVAIATFGSESISLGQALYILDHDLLDRLPDLSRRVMGAWSWSAIVQPLLVRPAWLIPASAGIICLGLSVSLTNPKTPHRSRRRS